MSQPPSDPKQIENKLLQKILHVSLEPSLSDTSTVFLHSLASELEQENQLLLLSVDNIDNVIWSLIHEKSLSPSSAFSYLFNSWRRAKDIHRSLTKSTKSTESTKLQLKTIAAIQPFLANYSLLTTTEPDVFENNDPPFYLSSIMLSDSDDSGLFWDFFNLIVEQAIQNDTLLDFLNPILDRLNLEIFSNNRKPLESRNILNSFEHLVSNKQVASAITSLDSFIPENSTAVDIEYKSTLGLLFSISPVNPGLAISTFPNESSFSSTNLNNAYLGIRAELNIIQSQLFFICDKIIRSSENARNKLLKYFGQIIDLNHKRVAIHVDPATVSSDAFMINITSILLRFSEPFIDVMGSKIDKIFMDYFRMSPVFSIQEETMINGDMNQSKEYYSTSIEGKTNFISDVFYLTVAYLHYGVGGCIQTNERTRQKLDDMKNHEEFLKRQLEQSRGSIHEKTAKMALKKLTSERNIIQAYYHLVGAVIYDSDMQSKISNFNLFLSVFMVRCVEPSKKYPQVKISLPIKQDAPSYFKYLPEYFVDIIPTYFIFAARHIPDILIRQNLSPLLVFLLTFLRQKSFIKNPYVKTRFVEVIFFGSIELYKNVKGFFIDLFNTDQLCLDQLLHTLMQFYIDIERTGASSQFEDKFNARYYISQVIKTIWTNRVYRQRLEAESKVDSDFFVKFVALLLNDATYLLDESLSKLSEIHRLQKELEEMDPANISSDQNELQRQLSSMERMAKSYVQLAQQSVILLKLFTSTVQKAFVTPELVDRLAAMLDYNLEALVGPKCGELKVKNPEQYGFKPRNLLSFIVDVYLNLSNEQAFINAVANDGRSYRASLFTRAIDILTKKHLKSPTEIDALKKFVNNTEKARNETEAGEEELGDIPDEFLDPLMYTLMENPVTLPSSKVNIDLSTIKSHLLSDSKDPFNRVPLTIDQVVPNNELKQKIKEFKESKRRNRDI